MTELDRNSSSNLHVFDNNIKVFRRHLIDVQIDRYKVNNLHEPEEEAIINEILDDLPGEHGIFIDVGAAIGYYLFLVSLKKPQYKLYAFEPLKEHRKCIKQNIKLNDINKRMVKIRKEALYEKSGFVVFNMHRYGSRVVRSSDSFFDFFKKNRIKSITLDEFCARERVEKIDLMKVDVQGGEISVLKGGINSFELKRIRNIIVGTHSRQIHEFIRDFFKKMDYKIMIDIENSELQPDGIIMAKI